MRYLRSHLIDPELLRADDFDAFMADRQKRLLGLIEQATGKAAYTGEAIGGGRRCRGRGGRVRGRDDDCHLTAGSL